MDVSTIVNSVLSIGGLGVVLGAGLGYAGEVFAVETDPKLIEIRDALPGANCGACGYPGCDGCAAAILEGKAPVNACPVGGATSADKIGAIMGIEASAAEKMVAFVKCAGTCNAAKNKYDYYGIEDCTMASQLAGGGQKSCTYGCLGYGSCVKACQFDAIHIVDGVAKVDPEKCVSCGQCVAACPKKLIELLPAKKKVKVQCSSKDAGKAVIQNCSVGCIACKICEKACPFDAIHVIDNIAVIDYEKCKGCGICANKCPKGVLTGKKPAAPAQAQPEAKSAAPVQAEAKQGE
ncbi:MAG: RnfABCDGE type electron transport complex subunit B [Clostridiales bacterium]|nr:RnfABCDGE type electron transport complex subunit B [Clostridiales bacterium]